MAAHFEKAVIRRMSDSVRLETLRGQGTGLARSTAESSSSGHNLAAALTPALGPATASALPQTGVNASAGVNATEADAVQQRFNEKPLTGRALLISVPVTALAEVAVTRHFKDGPLGPGNSRSAKTLRDTADLTVEMWITEAEAMNLGILGAEDTRPRLTEAWNAVNEAQTAVKDNSVAYDQARLPWFKQALAHQADAASGPMDTVVLGEAERAEIRRISDRFDASVTHYRALLKQAIEITQKYQGAEGPSGQHTVDASAEPPLLRFDRSVRHDHEKPAAPRAVARDTFNSTPAQLGSGANPVHVTADTEGAAPPAGAPTVLDLPIEPARDAVHVLAESPEAGYLLGALQAKGLAPSLDNLKEGGTLYVVGHEGDVGAGGPAIDEVLRLLGGEESRVKDFTIHMIVCKAAARQGRALSPAENFALTSGKSTSASTVDIALHARDRNGGWIDVFPQSFADAVELGRASSGFVLTGDVRTVTSDSVMDELIRQFQELGLDGSHDEEPSVPIAAPPTETWDTVSEEVYDVLSPKPVAKLSPEAMLDATLAGLGQDIARALGPKARQRAEEKALERLRELRGAGAYSTEQIRTALRRLPEPPRAWLRLFDAERTPAVTTPM
ncbi:hypothetical protein [Streptomyces sp. NPDC060198]|uniref:hypothetical protein n=1 Tax=Streptomyces sp. NPDC060198 TaxID=3347070 RepID=UPI00366293A2